jgi:hypothetical protein
MKKIIHILIAALIASTIVSINAQADTVSTTAELTNNKVATSYIYSRPLMERMFRLGLDEDKKFGLKQDCKSQYQTTPVNTIVMKPIVFSEDKQNPVNGVWMTRYRIVRCGDEKIYNALFFANTTGDMPIAKAFFPGSTNAGPQLVSDAMRAAVTKALTQKNDRDCKTAYVFDMRVTEPAHKVVEAEKTFTGVWNELWTLDLCGQMIDVPMIFIPDANGGGTSFTTGTKDK